MPLLATTFAGLSAVELRELIRIVRQAKEVEIGKVFATALKDAPALETARGVSLVGVIRRNLPESIVIADPAGQEHALPRAGIISMQALPTSLMPNGLDHTISEAELLDLVAFLHSRK